jgi:hypothetical protein
MFEAYKNRMAARGRNMSEMLRLQSNMVIEQTWERDPNYRQVYVVRVNHGLPEVTAKHELIDVKFNVESYQRLTSDEPAYLLQFRHGAEKRNSDIAIGSYVYMEDEDGEWKWWLLVALDERPQFRQYHILECNWTLKWIADNKIHSCLAVQRYQSSYSSGLQSGSRITGVDDMTAIWVPTSPDTQTIGYNQRFLISDVGRIPALCYEVSKISDTSPVGLVKLSLIQTEFNEKADNVDLMIADYYNSEFILDERNEEPNDGQNFDVSYNGTRPTIKVGGSPKIFTAQLPDDNHFDIKWSLSDGVNTYSGTYENYSQVFGNYTVTTDDRIMTVKVANDYNLIGTELTIYAECADGSTGKVKVEVVG